jgi:tetratricopeptide (TPR) repeat protein
MEELASYEPDLFIIYTGHNEFLEERTYGKLRDIPAVIKTTATVLARTRTWAAMSSVLNRLGAMPGDDQAQRVQLQDEVNPMLERFAGLDLYERDDELRDQIRRHYELSLRRMVDIARSSGADIIFVTPASNLKDSSPFKSQHTDGLDETGRRRSEELLASARTSNRESNLDEALAAVDQAIALDPRFAELHYWRGKVLFALGRYDEASAALMTARDEDVCPLRALSPMREVLIDVARETGTPWVDFSGLIEESLSTGQGYRIAGQEYFLDHVHPTIEGNRLLAVALIEEMIDSGIVRPTADWTTETIAEVAAAVEGDLDSVAHAQAMANLAQVLFWAGKTEEARRPAEDALASGVQDPRIVVTAARILGTAAAAEGDSVQAKQHFRTALNALPGSAETHFQVGLMHLNEPARDLETAAAHLFLVSVLWPDNDMAHETLGLAMAEQGHYAVAYSSLREARRLNPANADTERALGRLAELIGPQAHAIGQPEISVRSYSSGTPREVYQYLNDAAGRPVVNGIWTEWYEGGEPRRFVEFEDGLRHGVEVTWGRDGQVISRIHYERGVPASNL